MDGVDRAAYAGQLADAERAAFTASLAHVFDPAMFPYPIDAVRERWRRLLEDPTVVIDTVEAAEGTALAALLAHDGKRVLHLAVRPERWGEGLAGQLLTTAAGRIRAGGGVPVLWCLEANHRARRLYERHGWRPTGVRSTSEFAPYPAQLEYSLDPTPRCRP